MIYIITFGISVFIQSLFFFFAYRFKSDKFTDITYSLTFFLLALFSLAFNSYPDIHHYILFAVITVWSGRLGFYLLSRVIRTGRDRRFDGIRESFSAFAMFWALQAVSVWVIMLPAMLFIGNPGIPVNPFIFGAGLIIWLAGFIIEAVSDAQKSSFRSDPANNGRWIESGLWKYSRHPNFFGEALLWWGIFIAVVPGISGFDWLVSAGPLFITFLLLFVSGIPTVEKQSEIKYGSNPEYRRYKESTSIFIPMPRRNGKAQ